MAKKTDFEEGQRRIDEIKRRLGGIFGQGEEIESSGIGHFLSGLGSLLDQLKHLPEESHGEFGGKDIRGVYGFSVKTLGEEARVEPFGNIRKDEKSGRVTVGEIREPMTDIFEEGDFVLVVAEVPGIREEDVHLELHGDIVIFTAEQGESKYRKEILLPGVFQPENMSYRCRNGVLEIRFEKKESAK